jgi:hypothetical protein
MWYFGIPRPPRTEGWLSSTGVDCCGQRPGAEPAMSNIRNTIFNSNSARELKKEISLSFLASEEEWKSAEIA